MRPLTRRQLLELGLGAGTLGALAACATPGTVSVNAQPTIAAAGEPIRLTYWAWLKDLQKVADIWNAKNPGVQVEAVWIPGGNSGGYQKMYSALAAGGGPDLGQVEMRTVPEFMLVNGLVDLSRYGAEEHAAKFDQTLWNQVSFDGGVYGVPQDSGPMATFYQPAIFEQVGGAPPATWDEWAGLARELRGIGVYLDCFPISDAGVFTAFATQSGAQWLTPEEVLVPGTATALPLFLLFSQLGMANTYWSVLIPSLVSPFGLFLCRIYAQATVDDSLLEAARLDGAGELRIFHTIGLRILTPALVTVFLFQLVGIWNNYFLPLVMLADEKLYPITLGLDTWRAQTDRLPEYFQLTIGGALLSVIPLAILIIVLQRFWRGGLTEGSVKG